MGKLREAYVLSMCETVAVTERERPSILYAGKINTNTDANSQHFDARQIHHQCQTAN